MARTTSVVLLVAVVATLCAASAQGSTPWGAVSLDSFTFDKVVDRSRNVLVKFDAPENMEDDAFRELCDVSVNSTLLVAEVEVKVDNPKINGDLLNRFQLKGKSLPQYLLFMKDGDVSKPEAFSGDIEEVDELRDFVHDKTGMWIPLEGCIPELDEAALELSKDPSMLDKVLNKAKSAVGSMTDETKKKSASIYTEIFDKIKSAGHIYPKQELDKMAKEKLEKKAKSTVAAGADTVKKVVAGAAALKTAKEVKEQVFDGTNDASDRVHEGVDAAKERLREGYDAAKEKVIEGVDSAKEMVREGLDKLSNAKENAKDRAGMANASMQKMIRAGMDKVDEYKEDKVDQAAEGVKQLNDLKNQTADDVQGMIARWRGNILRSFKRLAKLMTKSKEEL
jgi:endoplasmic reticulum protein 29